MSMQQVAEGQANPEIVINRNSQTLEHQSVYGQRQSAHSGLTWGYYGGRWGGNSVSDGTVSLTNAATNYLVVNRSTGVLSSSTTNTNWNDTGTYARVYQITTAGSVVTATQDHRVGPFGVHGQSTAGGGVTGPGSSTSGNLAAFSGTGGSVLADSGAAPSTDGTFAANSNAKLPTEAAVKTYVDAKVAGLSWKQAVRVATTGAGTLATSFENGDSIDGVTLATGDRILIKNQASGAENGIYVVAASGAPTRATDADSGAELVNATVYVSEGTTNADTQWTCTTNSPITPGSTSLAFAQLATGSVSSVNGQAGAVSLNGGYVGVKGSDIASASTVDLSAATGDFVDVTGTTTITAFGTVAAGVHRTVRFTGALTLTHNATSLILPGGASITTAAGDVATLRSLGSGNWVCVVYQKANGQAVTGGSGTAGKHAIYIAAGSMRPSATGGCAALAGIASAANQPDIVTLDFDATTQEYAQFSFKAPKSSDETVGLTFRPIWSHAATTTNFGVVWDLQLLAVGDDDAIAQNFGTAQTSTDTGGTTNDVYIGPESSSITPAGSWAEGDMLFGRVSRVTGNGSDTMAIDARLHGIELFLSTNAENDA